MRRILVKSALTLIILMGALPVFGQVVVRVKPNQPAKIVHRPAQAKANHLWIVGHWQWNKRKKEYIWVDGYWIKENKGHDWINGHWQSKDGGFVWVPGHWKKHARKKNHPHRPPK